MPEGYDNTYVIIYNEDIDDSDAKTSLDNKIKKTVPFEAVISFQNDDYK